MARELDVSRLRWRCDAGDFEVHRDRVYEEVRLAGQPRALDALRLGLVFDAPGHNVFVCGPSGTGKMATVRALLAHRPSRGRRLSDYAFVHDFDQPDRPRLLRMPAGTARRFRRRFEAFVGDLPDLIRRALEAPEVERRREEIVGRLQALERELIGGFQQRCEAEKFALTQVEMGEVQHLDLFPIHRKEPIDIEELNERVASGKARVPDLDRINRRHGELKEELRHILARLRKSNREAQSAIAELEGETVARALEEEFADLVDAFDHDGVRPWLEAVARALTDQRDVFREDDGDGDLGGELRRQREALLRQLRVNIVLDNEGQADTPVVFENFPTFINLLGTIERPSDEGRALSDYTDIRAGSLLRADGGFLVLNADDAAAEPGVWRALLRVLKTGELEIQSPEQVLNPGAGTALKPQSIRVDVKVIAVGEDDLYHLLYTGSDEFRRVFKLKADFDDVMPLDPRNLGLYAHHAWHVIRDEGLVPIGSDALARLVEYGVRLAGRRDRLSTRFSDVTDVLREASHYARVDGAEVIGAAQVDRALAARERRHDLPREKVFSLLREGSIDVRTDGREIGTVNALTVLDLADHAFGLPCRMTASVAPGRDGITSIEREVHLSGRLHDKGTLTLVAYLRAHYLADRPMALNATLAFEQMHDEVDGDSATVAEAVALLSALAGVPVRQGVAVTGAVDQRGSVLPVGGINEKIEGFFRTCADRGLTGSQGVCIPEANTINLMLDDEVVAAVERGAFHVWSVRHLDEVVALVTGLEPGRRSPRGRFAAGTFNARVRRRLIRLSRLAGPEGDATDRRRRPAADEDP